MKYGQVQSDFNRLHHRGHGVHKGSTEVIHLSVPSSVSSVLSVVNALDSIKKPAPVIRSGPKIGFSVLTEFVKYFHQMFSNHLSISSFNVMTLNEVKQFTVFEECDGR